METTYYHTHTVGGEVLHLDDHCLLPLTETARKICWALGGGGGEHTIAPCSSMAPHLVHLCMKMQSEPYGQPPGVCLNRSARGKY